MLTNAVGETPIDVADDEAVRRHLQSSLDAVRTAFCVCSCNQLMTRFQEEERSATASANASAASSSRFGFGRLTAKKQWRKSIDSNDENFMSK